jgi:serine/threonine-protein kinase
VAVYDYGRSADGVFYYAMEYLGGGVDLEQLVRTRGPLPEGRVIHILVQVCGALHEAHNHGLVHRDIKPANIILCERGDEPDVAKVVDYGLVKEIDGDVGTSGQVVFGTPAYLAPELITDPASVGPSADLYALGAVGCFLLTGKHVFEGRTAVDMCIQHVSTAPIPPSETAAQPITAGLDDVLLRCLAKHPPDRPGSAADLAEALRALPSAQTWSTADARAWWRDHRGSEPPPSATSATVTLAIDPDRVS